jgi:hypothetical protein
MKNTLINKSTQTIVDSQQKGAFSDKKDKSYIISKITSVLKYLIE